MRGRLRGIVTAALGVLIAAAASASTSTPVRPPLGQVPHVWESLFAAAVGDRIRKNCPTISPRILVVLRKRRDLERYAEELGYSRAEIDAFIADEAEQARMRAQVLAYLAAHNVTRGDPESFCRLGRAEIARGSLIGQLLYEH